MMTDSRAPLSELTLGRLKRLLDTQDAKLALIAATGNDPDQRAAVEEKRARIIEAIEIKTDSTPRLPYAEPE